MLELYQKERCPFCQKVRQKLNDLELDFICRISKDGTKQREVMLKLGGQAQVPFLVDQERGVMMYESDDIIKYLDQTYGGLADKADCPACKDGKCQCGKDGSGTCPVM